MLNILGKVVVSGRDFKQLGFTLEGDCLVGHGLSVWICEDEERLDRYFYNGKKIKTKTELIEIIRNNGKTKKD